MNNKRTSRSRTVVALSLLGLILLAALALPAGAARWLGDAWDGLAGLARDAPSAPLASTNLAYVGTVELEWAMPGQLSDPLPTPTPNPDPGAPAPPDLGGIDLGLELIRSGNTISGFVDLDFTLVFTREHRIGITDFGPSLEGTFDGTNLALTSERVSSLINQQRLMRQFRLTGAVLPDSDGTLSGQYRETVWGYGPQPLTILGTFTLKEAIADIVHWRVYLPLVQR
jgi:hypothetical protein